PDAGSWQVLLSRGLETETDEIFQAACELSLETSGAELDATGDGPLESSPPAWRDLRTTSLGAEAVDAAARQSLQKILTIELPAEHAGAVLVHLLDAAGTELIREQLAALRLLLDQCGVALRNSQLYLQTISWAQRLARLQA